MALADPTPVAVTPLCVADDATFWPWRTWTDFARMSPSERTSTTIIVPIAGFADWGLGHPLDAEELVLMHLLRAVSQRRPSESPLLIIPPLRFVLGPDSGCAFAVDAPTAHAFIREVAASIAAAGFRRVILVNASPWNEELCAAASRDLRIEFGLQIFRINLGMIDLDFHPARSQTRRQLQTLLTALTGCEPAVGPTNAWPASTWGDEKVGPLAGLAVPLADAVVEGAGLLDAAAQRVVALLGEISSRPPLDRDGTLVAMTTP
jgi:creatinine amidohydrolase